MTTETPDAEYKKLKREESIAAMKAFEEKQLKRIHDELDAICKRLNDRADAIALGRRYKLPTFTSIKK